MLGTFPRLQAQRACVSFSTWVPQWPNHYSKAVMGTTWQHVTILKELNKILVSDLVPPSVCPQLIPPQDVALVMADPSAYPQGDWE